MAYTGITIRWLACVLAAISLIAVLAGCEAPAETPTGASPAMDTAPPTTPTNITMTEIAYHYIFLCGDEYCQWRERDSRGRVTSPRTVTELRFTWNPASDDISGVASYQVSLFSVNFTDIGTVTTYDVPVSCPERFPQGGHTFRVKAVDKAGNEGVPGELEVMIDTVAPTIMELGISSITATSAVITWTTDELTYGFVACWWPSLSFSASTHVFANTPGLSKKHTISLTGLEEGTTCYFQVKAIDKAEYRSVSPVISFTTLEE